MKTDIGSDGRDTKSAAAPSKPAPSKPHCKSARRSGHSKLGHSDNHETNRRAAIVLEVLAGIRTPGQAAKALQLSVNYYYVLERKALAGLVAACRPLRKGPAGPSLQRQLEQLQRQLQECQNECQRQAALVRATQRAVGLPATPVETSSKKKTAKKGGGTKGKTRRRRRPTVRALRAAESLRAQNSSLENSPEGIKQDDIKQQGDMQPGESAPQKNPVSSALSSWTQDQET